MSTTRRSAPAVVAALLVALLPGCTCCKVYCPEMLTLVFVDRAGAPLKPESVTIVEEDNPAAPDFNAPRTCASSRATCEGNRLTFDLSRRIRIRAVATTGAVFDGEVSPAWAQSPLPDGVCECHGTVATVELTLSPP